MSTYLTVIPAYGRDYKSQAEVRAAYNAGADFIIQDFFSGQDGRAINREDAQRAGVKLSIRYSKLQKIIVL